MPELALSPEQSASGLLAGSLRGWSSVDGIPNADSSFRSSDTNYGSHDREKWLRPAHPYYLTIHRKAEMRDVVADRTSDASPLRSP